MSIGLVFSLELINSALEHKTNFVSPVKNDFIKKSKDMAAASVLAGALTAAIIGAIVLLPQFLDF